jgi:urease accessory protein
MITVDSVLGNINNDKTFKEKYDEMSARKVSETIKISRLESQRVRMRKLSDKGTDVALTLQPGTRLKHGDVIILTENKMVVVGKEPEDVVMIQIRNNIHEADIVEITVRIGHIIGNLHKPIKLDGNKIYFRIQADTELEMFKKLFEPINEHLDIKKKTMVFEQEDGAEKHEHS